MALKLGIYLLLMRSRSGAERWLRQMRRGDMSNLRELMDMAHRRIAGYRRVYIDYPEEFSSGRYRQRFWEFASHGEDGDKEVYAEELDPDDPMLPLFRSQQAWDATMAQSIVNAKPTIGHKVILLVGQFHVEYDGGIVQELRNRSPQLKILVVSIQRTIPEEEWRGVPAIADLMVVETISD